MYSEEGKIRIELAIIRLGRGIHGPRGVPQTSSDTAVYNDVISYIAVPHQRVYLKPTDPATTAYRRQS